MYYIFTVFHILYWNTIFHKFITSIQIGIVKKKKKMTENGITNNYGNSTDGTTGDAKLNNPNPIIYEKPKLNFEVLKYSENSNKFDQT